VTVIADTGAIIALIDADDKHHDEIRVLFEESPGSWVIPWAVLPEVDYLLGSRVGDRARRAFMSDVAAGAFVVEWGEDSDLERARKLDTKYRRLGLGLVDGVVMAVAERRAARAIATLDVRHFGAVEIDGQPVLLPRDA